MRICLLQTQTMVSCIKLTLRQKDRSAQTMKIKHQCLGAKVKRTKNSYLLTTTITGNYNLYLDSSFNDIFYHSFHDPTHWSDAIINRCTACCLSCSRSC